MACPLLDGPEKARRPADPSPALLRLAGAAACVALLCMTGGAGLSHAVAYNPTVARPAGPLASKPVGHHYAAAPTPVSASGPSAGFRAPTAVFGRRVGDSAPAWEPMALLKSQGWVAAGLTGLGLAGAMLLVQLYGRLAVLRAGKARQAWRLLGVEEGGVLGRRSLSLASVVEVDDDALVDDPPLDGNDPSKPPLMVLSAVEDLMIGAVAGIAKIMIGMPLLTWKFKVQAGAVLPTTLGEWYRGCLVQAIAVTPIASLQMVINGVLSKVISGASPFATTLNRELTAAERMLAALGAGVVCALIYTPVDLLTLQQQQLGTDMVGAATYIVQHCGVLGLMRGVLAMAIREGIFTLGMLGLTPIISEWLAKNVKSLRNSTVATNVLGSVGAGVSAALLTHPMDTIKTQIQVDLMGETYTNIWTTTVLLVQNRGWGYLFLGTVPRTMMICVAFFIAATLQQVYMNTKLATMEVRAA